MREVADKIDWLYNEENGCLYKDKETLRRHNEYVKQEEKKNLNPNKLLQKQIQAQIINKSRS